MNSPVNKNFILLIQLNESSYNSLNYLQNLLGEEFEKLGFDVEKIEINNPQFKEKLISFLKSGQIYFAMGFSGIGSDILFNNELVWDVFKTPFFNWCCDHPCYYPSRHKISNQWLLNGFVFPDHARYFNDFFNVDGMTFQSHLGAPKRDSFALKKDYSKKNNRIIYTKSGTNIVEIEKRWQNLPQATRFILFSAKEELLYKSTENTFSTVCRIASEKNILMSPAGKFSLSLIRELDIYVRGWRANFVLNALLNFPIDIYGKSWDHINWRPEGGAAYKGILDLQSNIKILPEYLGSLSINPFIEDSVHDRVFYSIADHVVPISDSNRFSKDKLPLLEKYSFEFSQESIVSSVEALLKNPSEALERVESTRLSIEKDFSLGHSAQQIIEFVSYRNLNC